MRIGITDTYSSTLNEYIRWIRQAEPTAETITLSYRVENSDLMNDMDALVLTGGGDVHPKYYGKPELIDKAEGIDEKRDEFEFSVIRRALENDRPILAICRGMQILNVALDGTLIVDLPSSGFEKHDRAGNDDLRHPLKKVPHTML